MDDERSAAPDAKASDPLYDWWFEALPALFSATGVRAGQPAEAPGDGASAATAARAAQALGLSQQLFESLYGACFGALIQPSATGAPPVAAFETMLRRQVARVAAQWTATTKLSAGLVEADAALGGLYGSVAESINGTLKPLVIGAERAYGGLVDALGFTPLRELETAVRELAEAELAKRRAQTDYLALVSDALRRGVDALIARLGEMGQRGESVDTVQALMRLGAATIDTAVHSTLQSPRGLQASAEALRASLHVRQRQQRIVALVSEALNVPTRAEVDEAYREIQELKREVRRLRKRAPAATRQDAPTTPTSAGAPNGAFAPESGS